MRRESGSEREDKPPWKGLIWIRIDRYLVEIQIKLSPVVWATLMGAATPILAWHLFLR